MSNPNIRTIMSGIQWGQGVDPSRLIFDQADGFMRYIESDSNMLVGFSNGLQLEKQAGTTYKAITALYTAPVWGLNIDTDLGKAIEPRFDATREGVDMRLVPKGRRPGVFMLNLLGFEVYDMRKDVPGPLGQIMVRAGILMDSMMHGIERTTEINALYGSADIVIRPQSTAEMLRNASRRQFNPRGVSQAFMLVRNPAVPIRKIGEVSA